MTIIPPVEELSEERAETIRRIAAQGYRPGGVHPEVSNHSIAVEKMLCAALGREWQPSGMSTETLCLDVLALTDNSRQPGEAVAPDGWVLVPQAALDWLNGEAPDAAQRLASPSHQAAEVRVSQAIADVSAERRRQVEAEGWTPEHDDQHSLGEMAGAAACYAAFTTLPGRARAESRYGIPSDWPWAPDWWKPKDRRRDLVRAGALILAEIERLDRLSAVEP